MNWDSWKDFMVAEWTTLFPEELPMVFRWMADNVVKIYRGTEAIRVLVVKTEKEESEINEDTEMETADVPRTPYPTPMSSASPSPPAYKSNEAPTTEKEPQDIADGRAMDNLKEQVKDLEDRLKKSTKEIKKKLRKLEEDVFKDTLTLADLSWRTASLEEDNRKAESTEKKAYRKAGRTRHRHNTRYAAAQGDKPVQLHQKEYEAMEKRVKKVEDRIKEGEKEKDTQVIHTWQYDEPYGDKQE